MDFTPAEFPTTGVSEKEFIDKMIALAKAGEDEMEHLKCIFYTWAVFYEADEMCIRDSTRCNHHKILSLARLPVPTLPRIGCFKILYLSPTHINIS